MGKRQISPRIVLSIVAIIIGVLLLWNYWDGKLTDAPILTAIALILIGSQLCWMEMDERDD
jgi:drug/metabolite transporter (DMT)-like permease